MKLKFKDEHLWMYLLLSVITLFITFGMVLPTLDRDINNETLRNMTLSNTLVDAPAINYIGIAVIIFGVIFVMSLVTSNALGVSGKEFDKEVK
jgi:hypothetical protein